MRTLSGRRRAHAHEVDNEGRVRVQALRLEPDGGEELEKARRRSGVARGARAGEAGLERAQELRARVRERLCGRERVRLGRLQRTG
jgi:hypothetical protein